MDKWRLVKLPELEMRLRRVFVPANQGFVKRVRLIRLWESVCKNTKKPS